MSGTPQEFTLDISKFVAKAEANMDKVARKIVLDIGTLIIMRSPVGDDTYWKHPAPKKYSGGRFRGNWQYGTGVIPAGVLDVKDKKGAATIAKGFAAVEPEGAIYRIHYWANNLPYAQRLESGWSKRQAPAGMVGLTVTEFERIVGDAAQEVNP